MPKAQQMDLVDFDFPAMDLAATQRQQIRIRGRVADTGAGDSATYVWLHIRTSHVTIQVTASTSSPLGKAPIESEVELECTLTGMVDLAQGRYFAQQAQLLGLRGPADQV